MDLSEIQAAVRVLETKVYGNGEPGLLSDMRLTKERLDGLRTTSEDNNRRLAKIERVIYAVSGVFMVLQIALKLIELKFIKL